MTFTNKSQTATLRSGYHLIISVYLTVLFQVLSLIGPKSTENYMNCMMGTVKHTCICTFRAKKNNEKVMLSPNVISCNNIWKYRTSHFCLISSAATYGSIIFLPRFQLYSIFQINKGYYSMNTH